MSDIALQVDQTRAEGLIGASDAACALGLDPYRSPIVLWRKLRGLPVNEERPAFVQEAAEWGQALEPLLRGKYALARPAGLFVPDGSFVMDDWLRCTPDGIVVLPHPSIEHFEDLVGFTHALPVTANPDRIWQARAIKHARESGACGLWQGKTCSAYKRDEWQEWIPQAYEVQVRVEMAVTKLPWCDVTCLVGGQTLRGPFRVERDAALEDRILTDLRAFWRMVKEGREPTVDDSAGWRAHVSEKMQATKLAIAPSSTARIALEQWRRARAELKRAEAETDKLKTALLLELSAAGAQAFDLGAEGKASAYKTGARTDWKGVAESLGCTKAPERFIKPSSTWALRSPSSWGDDGE